jgi:hypothetical protein
VTSPTRTLALALPPPGPALTLHGAAAKLRATATAALAREESAGRAPTDWYAGTDNALGGPIGEFCGLLSPSLGLEMADWLDAVAAQAVRHSAGFGNTQEEITDGFPTVLARRVLGAMA